MSIPALPVREAAIRHLGSHRLRASATDRRSRPPVAKSRAGLGTSRRQPRKCSVPDGLGPGHGEGRDTTLLRPFFSMTIRKLPFWAEIGQTTVAAHTTPRPPRPQPTAGRASTSDPPCPARPGGAYAQSPCTTSPPRRARVLRPIAARHGVSPDAALALLRAMAVGKGVMAQFDHPELGGMGQWLRSGMVIVGDMFDTGLKLRVGALCSELAALLDEGGAPTSKAGSGSRPAAAGRRLVAGRAGCSGLERRPGWGALRLLPSLAPAGGAAGRPSEPPRHRAASHLRRFPAAGHRPVAGVLQRSRRGPPRGPAPSGRARRNPATGASAGYGPQRPHRRQVILFP